MPDQELIFRTDIQPVEQGEIELTAANDFDLLIDLTTSTLAESSRRVYAVVYLKWYDWCEEYGITPLALTLGNIERFLISLPVTRATRERYLVALRKAAETLALVAYDVPEYKIAYEILKKLKTPTKGATDSERQKVALSPAQCECAINCWNGDTNRELRNRAIVAVLLLTGMRRAECAVLKWQDIDLHEGVIDVRHGKGDKRRDVAIYGEAALAALDAWKLAQGGSREYVFCAVTKGDNLGPDQPMDASTIYRAVKATEKRAGLDHFSPHDARRTMATELLETGDHVRDVQEQLGHAKAQTTLRYAQTVDARERRKRGKVRYG